MLYPTRHCRAGLSHSVPAALESAWPCRTLLLLLLWLQLQRCRVHAIAHSRRPRAVGKNVAQVCIAAGATHFGAAHAVGAVGVFLDRAFGNWLVKARPAGAGIKFCL